MATTKKKMATSLDTNMLPIFAASKMDYNTDKLVDRRTAQYQAQSCL